MTLPLSLAALDTLPAQVARPAYTRADLSPGILHFGVGNFHRAHQAMTLDRLFSMGEGRDWGIVGAGIFDGERKGRDVLAAQDWLTTLVEQEADRSTARVIGSMVDFIEPANAPAIIARMLQPDIRIVSLTITEGGYFLDSDDAFDPAHPALQADAAQPDEPKTVFGIILAGLRARRAAGLAPFTIMSCDNIPHNGAVTRSTLTGLAQLSDPGFAQWITENVAFPNSMVDRITPVTEDRERRIVAEEFGIVDGWPVFCEGFFQWVMEDTFPLGRPPFEKAGVQFSTEVGAFEVMKLRILNGGHAAIAYPAGLLDVPFARDAMDHPLIRQYLNKLTHTEIIPTVPPVPGTDLSGYADLIERRFANPKIGDKIERLCFDGSNRQPKFILPTLRAALATGGRIEGLALECALWCRYCAGISDSGAIIPPNDPDWAALTIRAQAARETPGIWLELEAVYGDLAGNDRFAEAFARWLNALGRDGTAATLRAYLDLE